VRLKELLTPWSQKNSDGYDEISTKIIKASDSFISSPLNVINLYYQESSLTYLLTYSMEQSPSWEANWSAASQEIRRILWNSKVHHRTHKPMPPGIFPTGLNYSIVKPVCKKGDRNNVSNYNQFPYWPPFLKSLKRLYITDSLSIFRLIIF
jgi:hypothetical protein